MSIKIQNGLPLSHKWKTISIGGQLLKGILWDQNDVNEDDQIILYKKWASVHFDSDWYEIAVGSVSNSKETARDITILKSFFGKKLNSETKLIDVNCGISRHLIKLAKDKIFGVGMEGAELLRNIGKEMAKKEKISIDIVSTSRYFQNKYCSSADIVTSLFNSMGYTFNMNDDIHRLQWMINLLKSRGYFLLDIRAEEYQKIHYSSPQITLEKIYLPTDSIKTPITIRTQKYWKDGILAAEERITVETKIKTIVQNTSYGWRTYSLAELEFILKKVGMRLLETKLDYYTSPKNVGERIFLLSQKID